MDNGVPTPSPEPARDEPFWGWVDLATLVATLPLCYLASLLLTRLAIMLLGARMNDTGRALTLQSLLYLAVFGALTLQIQLRHLRSVWPALRLHVQGRAPALLLFDGAWISIAAIVVGVALRAPQIDNPIVRLLADPLSAAALIVYGCTLAPAAEEALFRGFLQPLVLRATGATVGGVVAAIALTSLLFAALHGFEYSWSWRHLAMIFLASCGFGYTRWRTGSTGSAALVHAGYNLTFFLLYLLSKRMLPTHG